MTKLIKWNGDYANEPKTGVALIVGELAHITWTDGSKNVIPLFTMLPRYGWTVKDA